MFFGLSSAALAYVITRDGLWRVHVFMSAPFVTAALLVQFSPLLMAATFLPAVGFLTTLKPNIGLPLLALPPDLESRRRQRGVRGDHPGRVSALASRLAG